MKGSLADSRGRPHVVALTAAVGVVALLDLTTSAIPSFIDVFGPIPRAPSWVRWCELVLLLASAPTLARLVRGSFLWVRGLPGSGWGRALLVLYVAGMFVTVAIRTEAYPFSNVGMFSTVPVAPINTSALRSGGSIVFIRGQEVLPVAPLREGSAVAATLVTDWDYKMGWAMYMFGTSDSHALEEATRVARENGYERAARATVDYEPLTGRVVSIRPYTRTAGRP